MALDVTPSYRNLRTRITFWGLEAEDLFFVLGLTIVVNVVGRFFNRDIFGLPMNMVIQYFVPLLSVPVLILFKYGKAPGYLTDFVMFQIRPHIYSGFEQDKELTVEYLSD